MIAKTLNLFGLLGAVVWLARAPDWEPAITSVGLLATLIGLEVRSQRTHRNKTGDQRLFEQLLREFPSNGNSARFLRDQDLGAPFHESGLKELDRFVAHWDNAEHEFHDNGLEARRKDFYKRCREFRNRLAINIGLVGRSSEFYSMGLDDFETRPEKLELQRSLNEEATAAYHAHQELVRAGRRLLERHG